MKHEFRAAVEQRIDDESRTIGGYAALYDSPSVDMGFVEVIQRGAFASSLRDAADGRAIFAFWNHNSDLVLGSTRSKTLRLVEDERGLRFDLDTGGMTDQQMEAVRRGDMQMSFGFSVRDGAESWSQRDGKQYRTLFDVNLYEVSPVPIPAYPDTSVAMRSLENAKQERERREIEAKKAADSYFQRKAETDQRVRGIR